MRKSLLKYYLTGFTLIEVLVAMTIIGLLVIGITTSISNSRLKSRDTRRREDLKTLQNTVETFMLDRGQFPRTDLKNDGVTSMSLVWFGDCYDSTSTLYRDDIYEYGYATQRNFPSGLYYIPYLVPNYLSQLPIDPKYDPNNSNSQCYLYKSNGDDYKILAQATVESWANQADKVPNSDPMNDPFPARSGDATFAVWSPGAETAF